MANVDGRRKTLSLSLSLKRLNVVGLLLGALALPGVVEAQSVTFGSASVSAPNGNQSMYRVQWTTTQESLIQSYRVLRADAIYALTSTVVGFMTPNPQRSYSFDDLPPPAATANGREPSYWVVAVTLTGIQHTVAGPLTRSGQGPALEFCRINDVSVCNSAWFATNCDEQA